MRMRVPLRRRAMRCPARMGDAGGAADVLLVCLRGELGDAARGAYALHRPALYDRDARRVIAAVFEAPQSFDEDGNDVAPGGGAYDSAHRLALGLLRRFPAGNRNLAG